MSSWCFHCFPVLETHAFIPSRRKEKELERQQKINEIKAQPVPRVIGGVGMVTVPGWRIDRRYTELTAPECKCRRQDDPNAIQPHYIVW